MKTAFIDGGYERIQQAIQAMKSRFPEAAEDLHWLQWRLVAETENQAFSEAIREAVGS